MIVQRKAIASLAAACVFASLAGCRPSAANTQLRKDKQQLESRIAQLEKQREGDLARIKALEGPGTRSAITQDKIARLYTAHGLNFGKLTGGYKQNDKDAEDAGVVVHVVPTDEQGQTLKAAGSFVVNVFDLSKPERALVGSKRFSLDEAKANWYGHAMLFNYVLKVPFQARPEKREVLVTVEFTDELTGRVLTAERKVNVNP